jgi:hypothetical protein
MVINLNFQEIHFIAKTLTREDPQVCPGDFNENDVGLLSQVYLSQV